MFICSQTLVEIVFFYGFSIGVSSSLEGLL